MHFDPHGYEQALKDEYYVAMRIWRSQLQNVVAQLGKFLLDTDDRPASVRVGRKAHAGAAAGVKEANGKPTSR
jgi:hypothetical protein